MFNNCEIAAACGADRHDLADLWLEAQRKKLESPIEERLFDCLSEWLVDWAELLPDLKFCLRPQVQIGKFRVDFQLSVRHPNGVLELVIECDGHNFHERTPEQAQRDKARDIELQARGYAVLRFTGTHINREQTGVCLEILRFIGMRVGKMRTRRLPANAGMTAGLI